MARLVADAVALTRIGKRVLDGFSLRLDTPGPTCLIGPNGAGKSLALRVLHGLVPVDAGQVHLDDKPLTRTERLRQAMVFQKPVLLRRSTEANIAFALRASGQPPTEAARWLEVAGLSHLATQPARSLSGGEAQRLALVRALATAPEILFLDEPTSALDPAATARIETLIMDAAAGGIQVVMVSHDLWQVRRLAQRVVMMHKGRVIEDGPASDVLDTPREQETRAFLAGELLL